MIKHGLEWPPPKAIHYLLPSGKTACGLNGDIQHTRSPDEADCLKCKRTKEWKGLR